MGQDDKTLSVSQEELLAIKGRPNAHATSKKENAHVRNEVTIPEPGSDDRRLVFVHIGNSPLFGSAS
jgi:hypothetical protein